jgi:hypothetical protein
MLESLNAPSIFSSKTNLVASTLLILLLHWFHLSPHHNISSYRLIRILSIEPEVETNHYSSLRCITTIMAFGPSRNPYHLDPQNYPPPLETYYTPLEGIDMPHFIKDEGVSRPPHTISRLH